MHVCMFMCMCLTYSPATFNAGLTFAVNQAPTSARNIEEMAGIQYLHRIEVEKKGSEVVRINKI